MTFFPNNDYHLQIAKGIVPGHTLLNYVATIRNVSSTYEDVWPIGGIMAWPSAAESWELVSSDANDASGDTGARTVLVSSLNDSYVTQTQSVTLNGTTPVALTGTHFRPDFMICTSAGSSGVNEGGITLRVASAGATRDYIETGDGRSHSSHLTVPAGNRIAIFSNNFFCPKGDDITIKPIGQPFGSTAFASGGDISLYQVSGRLPLTVPFMLPAKTDFKFQAKSTVATASVTAILNMILIADGF